MTMIDNSCCSGVRYVVNDARPPLRPGALTR